MITMHVSTLVVFAAVALIAFHRAGLAAVVGAIGLWLAAHGT